MAFTLAVKFPIAYINCNQCFDHNVSETLYTLYTLCMYVDGCRLVSSS